MSDEIIVRLFGGCRNNGRRRIVWAGCIGIGWTNRIVVRIAGQMGSAVGQVEGVGRLMVVRGTGRCCTLVLASGNDCRKSVAATDGRTYIAVGLVEQQGRGGVGVRGVERCVRGVARSLRIVSERIQAEAIVRVERRTADG